jgi:sugar-phosphatase
LIERYWRTVPAIRDTLPVRRKVLFDVDGVLIDSGSMYAATWGAWADLRGVDRTVMFEGIHGERGIDTVARVAPEFVADAELAVLAELLSQHEDKASAYVGAAALLREHAGRCGLVTSAPRESTLARFERLGLRVPNVVVGGEVSPTLSRTFWAVSS